MDIKLEGASLVCVCVGEGGGGVGDTGLIHEGSYNVVQASKPIEGINGVLAIIRSNRYLLW